MIACLLALPFLAGCELIAPRPAEPAAKSALPAGALVPSPRLMVGRIISVDASHRFAFIELANDAPKGALIDGTELMVRTADLRDNGRLQASPYLRGRTLGTKIMSGQPSPGDEVVWVAP